MSAFADSSALAKLYFDEVDHDAVRTIRRRLTVSGLSRVEIASALWRKQREGVLDPAEVAALQEVIAADWSPQHPRFAVLAVSRRVLTRAARIVGVHALRSLDAIQLSSALIARDAEPAVRTFIAFDERLRNAAAAEGFEILPRST